MDFDNIRYDAINYNCLHFVIDIFKFYTNIDLTSKLILNNKFNPSHLKNFIKLTSPAPYCIVLFRNRNEAHVGLYVDDKVIHLSENGVVYQPLTIAKLGFTKIEYYEEKEYNHARCYPKPA